MDTGLNIRPVQPVSTAPARVIPPVERQTAASELPAPQAVTAPADASSTRFREEADGRNLRAALNAAIDKKSDQIVTAPVQKVVRDEATKELIFRKVRPDTGQVVGQYPDEAMLRLKAYNAQVRREELATADARRALFA
jgi:4-hydroxy-L-threonine phosphate dehydrogenase PdxA